MTKSNPKGRKSMRTGVCRLLANALTLVCIAAVVSASSSSTQNAAPLASTREFYEILFSDLVVRGTVLSMDTELLPFEDVFPEYAGRSHNGFAEVHKITLDVTERMKGDGEIERLVFAATSPARIPRLNAGQQVIVGLQQVPKWLDGEMLRLRTEEGLYVYDGTNWVAHGPILGGREYTIEQIEYQLKAVSMPQLTRSADAVFIGTVTGVSSADYLSPKREFAEVATLSFSVETILKGFPGKDVEVSMIGRGMFWPSWRGKMPQHVNVGERYFVFLSTDDGVTFALGGINGFYQVVKDSLFYDNRLKLPIDTAKVADMVRRTLEDE